MKIPLFVLLSFLLWASSDPNQSPSTLIVSFAIYSWLTKRLQVRNSVKTVKFRAWKFQLPKLEMGLSMGHSRLQIRGWPFKLLRRPLKSSKAFGRPNFTVLTEFLKIPTKIEKSYYIVPCFVPHFQFLKTKFPGPKFYFFINVWTPAC